MIAWLHGMCVVSVPTLCQVRAVARLRSSSFHPRPAPPSSAPSPPCVDTPVDGRDREAKVGDDLAQAVAVFDARNHRRVERRRPDWSSQRRGSPRFAKGMPVEREQDRSDEEQDRLIDRPRDRQKPERDQAPEWLRNAVITRENPHGSDQVATPGEHQNQSMPVMRRGHRQSSHGGVTGSGCLRSARSQWRQAHPPPPPARTRRWTVVTEQPR